MTDGETVSTTVEISTDPSSSSSTTDENNDNNDLLFPSREISKKMRHYIFNSLKSIWVKFENHGWKIVFFMIVYITFRRKIKEILFKIRERMRMSSKSPLSMMNEDDEKMQKVREKQAYELKKASEKKNPLANEKNKNEYLEKLEAKAKRLGVPEKRKGYVLGSI